MNNKLFLIVSAVLVVISLTLSSCDRHTCPTYTKVECKTAEHKA